MEQQGLEPMPKWDANVVVSGLTHDATTVATSSTFTKDLKQYHIVQLALFPSRTVACLKRFSHMSVLNPRLDALLFPPMPS